MASGTAACEKPGATVARVAIRQYLATIAAYFAWSSFEGAKPWFEGARLNERPEPRKKR